tara:strand:- start:27066 stop:27323 length:258 start_codon:yes stop_codon:yes gene_type:complete
MTGPIMGEFVRGKHHIIREIPVDDDTRGPDSLECYDLNGNFRLGHSDCFFDYSKLPLGLGFLCGCVCHDDTDEPESDGDPEEAGQ